MGMDVYGTNPTSEKGNYFRNNIWWWRPLWKYCEDTHPGIASKVQYAYSNDGDGLDEHDSRLLAKCLIDEVKSGAVATYSENYYKGLSELELEVCEWCEGTGIRKDLVGITEGFVDKVLDEKTAVKVGREIGWCNGCGGIGQKANWAMEYPFSVENVQEFGEFLADCGGFQIC
jgi:hypothetical protein